MMINYNVTGPKRKELAGVIAQTIGAELVYQGVPTCAYTIAGITLSKSGEMTWDEQTNEDAILQVKDAAAAAGFTAELEPIELTVSIPTANHSVDSLRNLINLFYTRARLINKALGTSFLVPEELVRELAENDSIRTVENFCRICSDDDLSGITITPETITFGTLPETADPDRIKAFTVLVAAMAKQALKQKRIQAKEITAENEKYALRIWLTRLGLNGPEHKTTRKILMENLSGNCAFRTDAERERWQARQAERRAAE